MGSPPCLDIVDIAYVQTASLKLVNETKINFKATPEMDNKAGGLFCVFSNGPSVLGVSAPTVYTIHSAPSARNFSNIISL